MNPTGDIHFHAFTSTITAIDGPGHLGSSQIISAEQSVAVNAVSADVVTLSPEAIESQKIQGWVKELKAMPEFKLPDLRSIAQTIESQMVSTQVVRSVAEKIGEELYFFN